MSHVRIIPLGGLGEVGMNCMIFETDTSAILLDCGTMASHHPWLGFDFIIPDFTYLKTIQHKLKALVVTHGHEDHIGAIPYLLDEVKIPKILCSQYTYEILKFKLNKLQKSAAEFEFIEIAKTYECGDFIVSYFPITHSIVESHLLSIQTPAGEILHTGDFKVDPQPYIDWNIRWDIMTHLQPDLLLSDSTNSEKKGRSKSEATLFDSFEKKFQEAQGNIFVCCFSSHSPRMQIVFDVAKKLNKTVALVGASMVKFFDINRRLGYIKVEGVDLITDESKIDLAAKNTVFMCTGSQGEYAAAMAKILRNENPFVKITTGDTLILSALKIPGNEINVRYLINSVSALGCKVYHQNEDEIHTSGHAYQDEQTQIFEFFKPKNFLPVHGDFEMLRTHIETAKKSLPQIHTELLIDGQVAVLKNKQLVKTEEVVIASKRWARGQEVGGMDDIRLRERKKIARDGVVVAFLFYEKGKLYDLPRLQWVGIQCAEDKEASILSEFSNELKVKVCTKEEAELILARIIKKYIGYKPAVRCKMDG